MATFLCKHTKCFMQLSRYRHAGTNGERSYGSFSFLTSALDGGEWLRHTPAAIYPRGRTPGTHLIGGWLGPRAGLDTRSIEFRNVNPNG
jgi:hypothetical protein